MQDGLSHWGWGQASQFADHAARSSLAEQVQALLGFDALEVADPVSLDRAQLPAPRLTPSPALADFASVSPRQRARHSYGRAFPDQLRGLHGDFSAAPDMVLFPRDEAQVEVALAEAGRLGAALVPFGGGTSVVAGVECEGKDHAGVICLDMTGMDRVLEVDAHSLAARIQAGARGPVLEQQLAQHGLTLRFYPQSFEFSTLGGWIATRAGGHFSTLHTHIDDLVQSVRMLTPSGPWESRRLPASGAGPSPDRLVLGSEGSLGVITEAWMRVRPRPQHRSRVSLGFPDWAAAVAAVHALSQSGLHPSMCRLLDRREALLHRVSFDGVPILMLGFESAQRSQADRLAHAQQLAEAHGGVVREPAVHQEGARQARDGAAETWRQAFLQAPYLFTNLVSMGLVVDTFETAVTWDRFATLHAHIVEQVRAAMKQACGGGVLSCRFTHVYPDGPAPYYTFVAPGSDGRRLAQWTAIKTAANDAIVAAGGTITHHHAVGRTHKAAWAMQRPAPFAGVLTAVKNKLDPEGVLNPGVLFDPER